MWAIWHMNLILKLIEHFLFRSSNVLEHWGSPLAPRWRFLPSLGRHLLLPPSFGESGSLKKQTFLVIILNSNVCFLTVWLLISYKNYWYIDHFFTLFPVLADHEIITTISTLEMMWYSWRQCIHVFLLVNKMFKY